MDGYQGKCQGVYLTIIHVYIQKHLCVAKHFPGRFEWMVIKENIKVCIKQ